MNLSAITDKELQFNQGIEAWEKLLIKELKIDEIGQRTLKKHLDLNTWKILSLEGQHEVSLPSSSWKKASQTYIKPHAHLNDYLNDDLESGVRLFFFHKQFFSPAEFEKIFKQLSSHENKSDIICILLGNEEVAINDHGLNVIDENKVAVGRSAHDQGANTVHELGLMGYCLTLKLNQGPKEFHQAVFLDSRFFNNIAKVRAAKLIGQKILEAASIDAPLRTIGLNSYRDWTLYERYSNMLRNSGQVSSALIAGADLVQSSGYQALFEMETDDNGEEHMERSLRMARNTSHILSLESMLGVVDDAAYGSFHLEEMTHEYAQKGWEFMQELLKATSVKEKIQEVSEITRSQREKNIHTRKHVLAGLNDFADASEKIKVKSLKNCFYRSTRSFEELRIKIENMKNPPEVFIGVFGDYALLNPRLNFAKNFFEVLGLKVADSEIGLTDPNEFKKMIDSRKEEIIVYCSLDADYEKLNDLDHKKNTFLAGKAELKNCKNIFAGQDIYSALSALVEQWS